MTDADTDTGILARILARIVDVSGKSARMSVSVSVSWNSSFTALGNSIVQMHV